MRIPMIAGNWKLHKTLDEATALVKELIPAVADNDKVEIVVAPVYTALSKVAEVIADSNIKLAAQNCYPEPQGAFTGEVSAPLLKDAGCQYIIIGHSERRQLFGETDETVNRKAHAIAETGLGIILCIGETLEEREGDRMLDVLRRQVRFALRNLSTAQMADLVIAYEPVWAIGTGKTATPDQAQEVHAFIRGIVRDMVGAEAADAVRIQYGGSMKPDNAAALLAQADIDGGLIGGASLDARSFAEIVRIAFEV